jgi:hypothetical protein
MTIHYTMLYSDSKGAKNSLFVGYTGLPELEYPISNILLNSKLIRNVKVSGVPLEPESMMEVVDLYLKTLPLSTQRTIYDTMASLHDVVYMTDAVNVMKALKDISYKVFSLPGLGWVTRNRKEDVDMVDWVAAHAEIPATVFECIEDAPPSYQRESTYLVHEYLDLVSFNIYVKVMYPMIVVATQRLMDIYGKKYIMKLTECICLPEVQTLPAYKKLYSYIEYFANQNYDVDKNSLPAMERLLYESSISSSEMVDYLLAEIVTRRIVSCRTLRDIESAHIIVRMYSRLNSIRDGKSIYTDKNISREGSDEPHKSVIDEFRIKDRLDVDLQVQLVHIINPEYLALHLNVPITTLKKLYGQVKRDGYPHMDSLQLAIIRFSVGHIITPNTLHLLTREKMILLAIATHLYLRENFPSLAAFLVSKRISTESGDSLHSVVQKILSKETAKELLRRYPFDLVIKMAVSERRVSKRLRVTDFIKRTVDDYRAHYASYVPGKHLDGRILPYFNDHGGLIPINNLADQLGDLILSL